MDRVSRREAAYRIRVAAAQLARDRPHEVSYSNGEEGRYRDAETGSPSYTANFTKGLPHRPNGQLANPSDYIKFIRAIDSGSVFDIREIPLGPLSTHKNGSPRWRSRIASENNASVRAWESMGAGLAYSIEGPDAQSVAMPPAPTLSSCELIAEVAELYLMALHRDLPFASWGSCRVPHPKIAAAAELLNDLHWFQHNRKKCCAPTDAHRARRRSTVRPSNIFRGAAPGTTEGPYLSQFLLVGTTKLRRTDADVASGVVRWGAQSIVQKVSKATAGKDYMTDFNSFLDVQDGADLRGLESYESTDRFITTPRDLATYVHYDALYQAYLTACDVMLVERVPFDPGLPFQAPDAEDKQQGFAHFGGPHILSLVCEVATRALKAVRYQKFNVHRRVRPEAVCGLLDVNVRSVCNGAVEFPEVSPLADALQPILCKIEAHNHKQNLRERTCGCADKANGKASSKSKERSKSSCKAKYNADCSRHSKTNGTANGKANGVANGACKWKPSNCTSYLLPMAYPEGSPMHPAYGAGHATVAGACVTILKAFFDSNYQLEEVYEPSEDGSRLIQVKTKKKLTVGQELNKLAENVSIGRNWAGVHYYSDYFESVRLGEKIAIGILEEQKLLFGENFYMSLDLFDGNTIRI